MKKIKKGILAIASIGLVLGLILTATGYFAGGVDELNTIYLKEQKETFYSQTLDNFDSIKLVDAGQRTGYYDLVIKTTDQDKAYISYAKQAKDDISISKTDKTLTITDKSKSATSDIQVSHLKIIDLVGVLKNGTFTEQYKNEIFLYIPKNQVLSQISGTFSGSVTVEEQTISDIKLTVKSGDFSVTDSKVSTSDVTIELGDLYILSSQVQKTTISLQTGEAHMENANITDSTMTLSTGDFITKDSSISTSNLILELGIFYIYDSKVQKTTTSLQTGHYYATDVTYLGENTISADSGDIDISLSSYKLSVSNKEGVGDSDITDQLQDSSDNSLTIKASVGDISVQ